MKTDVTVLSNNISNKLLLNYKGYYVIKRNFSYDELVLKKKVVFFNILDNINYLDVSKLFDFLRKKNVDFINITNNSELALLTKYTTIYKDDKTVLEGETLKVMENDSVFRKLGLKIPFMINLSILLKDYGVINEIVTDMDSLRDMLWK